MINKLKKNIYKKIYLYYIYYRPSVVINILFTVLGLVFIFIGGLSVFPFFILIKTLGCGLSFFMFNQKTVIFFLNQGFTLLRIVIETTIIDVSMYVFIGLLLAT